MPVVEVVVDAVDAELAADALWQAGPSAVTETAVEGGRIRLVADVTDPGLVEPRWAARVVEPDTDAHLDGWREWARPVRVSRRLVLQPSWVDERILAEPGDLTILLDPGRAFGSGSHPSTRLVLQVLDEVIVGGERVLDVGSGSGVLAVAACRLGAHAAVAVDIDPAAGPVTRANATANGVEAKVTTGADLATVTGTFDLVVANIGARVLRELAGSVSSRVEPGGLLVLAGLLEGQVDGVLAAYPGFGEVERRTEDGWAAPVLRRRRDPGAT